MLALLPSVLGAAVVAWLLWPALAELAGDLMSRAKRWCAMGSPVIYQARHSTHLIVKNWKAEEAAYQDALDKVWIGAIAEMAERASYRREIAWH
jgi:hypothetical protein